MKIKINFAALFRSLEVCLAVQTGSKVMAEEKKGLCLLRIRHNRTGRQDFSMYTIERFIMKLCFRSKVILLFFSRFFIYRIPKKILFGQYGILGAAVHRVATGEKCLPPCISGTAIELWSEVASTSSSPLSQPRRRHVVTGLVQWYDVCAASFVFCASFSQ